MIAAIFSHQMLVWLGNFWLFHEMTISGKTNAFLTNHQAVAVGCCFLVSCGPPHSVWIIIAHRALMKKKLPCGPPHYSLCGFSLPTGHWWRRNFPAGPHTTLCVDSHCPQGIDEGEISLRASTLLCVDSHCPQGTDEGEITLRASTLHCVDSRLPLSVAIFHQCPQGKVLTK